MMTQMNQVIGRPRRDIEKDEIDVLRRSGLKWIDISNLLGISKSSLKRWRDDNNYNLYFVLIIMNYTFIN